MNIAPAIKVFNEITEADWGRYERVPVAIPFRVTTAAKILVLMILGVMAGALASAAGAQEAWVRVNQVGYESGKGPFRAYLMCKVDETGATFKVTDSQGRVGYSAGIGALVGTWGHSATVTYKVYALDFTVPRKEVYTIEVKGPKKATSPAFPVNTPDVLYPGLLLNSLFFYETERDGAKYVPNALRDGAGHLKDENAVVYVTPPLDDNDDINNVPPAKALVPAGIPNIDASGGMVGRGRLREVRGDDELHRSADGNRSSRFPCADGSLGLRTIRWCRRARFRTRATAARARRIRRTSRMKRSSESIF